MCRIVGRTCCSNQELSSLEKSVIRMRDAMSHGGPDDKGIYIDKELNVVFGHRRLSIIDPSPLGHQPMSNEDGSIWINYNGEVYNFRELRSELTGIGYRFKSNTDTEVIIKAFEEWGENTFEKFIGMFAFSILDRNSAQLYLVRDYAGIKPLYYFLSDSELTFSSEIKTFKILKNGRKEYEDWKIYFLLFGHIPEPFTTLEDVYMLPKGTYLKYDLRNRIHSIHKYTDFKFNNTISDVHEATSAIRQVLHNSVQRHMFSDTPIGVFLSGGLDSGLIALLASQNENHKLRTLSVIFDEEDFSEQEYQKSILEKINSEHTFYKVTEQDLINNLEDILLASDQPSIDGINSYFISKCAHEEGLKAVLSGLGGDELFGGYPSFTRMRNIWFLRHFKTYFSRLFSLCDYSKNDKLNKLSFLTIDNPLSFYLLLRGLFTVNTVSKILDVKEQQIYNSLEKLYLSETYETGYFNFVTSLESNLYMQNQLLKDVDYMSMWHSLEVRVPFLDKELLNLVFSIDEKIKESNEVPKGLLIETFKDLLPGDIVSRSKQGFAFPFQKWMGDNLQLLNDLVYLGNNRTVRKITDKFQKGSLHWSRFWALVVLSRHS